jgi:hypothetical protein
MAKNYTPLQTWRVDRLMLALVLIAMGGCKGTNPLTGSATIEYRASAQTRVSVTYATTGGGTAQQNDVPSRWSTTISAQRGDFLYISAQQGNTTGCVLVRIIRGGNDIQSGQSCGPFAIATASTTQ